MGDAPIRYVASLRHVREVSLLCTADWAYWQRRLAPEDLVPAERDGRAQILVIAADARFWGVRFQELSFSVVVSYRIVTFVIFAPEGIALAAAILCGRRYWAGVFLGQFLLGWSSNLPLAITLAIAVSNSLEAVIGATLFARFGISRELARLRDEKLIQVAPKAITVLNPGILAARLRKNLGET